jgi:hypothetical protein
MGGSFLRLQTARYEPIGNPSPAQMNPQLRHAADSPSQQQSRHRGKAERCWPPDAAGCAGDQGGPIGWWHVHSVFVMPDTGSWVTVGRLALRGPRYTSMGGDASVAELEVLEISTRERLLIRAVDRLYRNGGIDDTLWLALRGTFSEAAIVDIVMLCG